MNEQYSFSDVDPDNPVVIDAYVSEIYTLEAHNHYSNNYALQVLHHYFGDFDDEWYHSWIGMEEFRGAKYPDGRKIPKKQMRRYEKMYDLYWDARAEWFYKMVANINAQNLREASRAMFLHTMTKTQSWEKFGREARKPENHINHNLLSNKTKESTS